jgi:hypothetical protein
LERRAHERDFPHGPQFVEREFEAQGKEQERHPNLCQQFDIVNPRDRDPSRVGTNQHAGQNVAEDQGLLQALDHQTAKQPRHHNKHNIRGNTHGYPFCEGCRHGGLHGNSSQSSITANMTSSRGWAPSPNGGSDVSYSVLSSIR